MNKHNLRRFFFDILRDTNTSKYSMTKFAALVGLLLLTATVVMSLILMWKTKIVDHVLFLELLGFVLTLLGFKNNFGFRTKDSQVIAPNGSDDNQGQMGGGAKEMQCEIKPDKVNDSLTN